MWVSRTCSGFGKPARAARSSTVSTCRRCARGGPCSASRSSCGHSSTATRARATRRASSSARERLVGLVQHVAEEDELERSVRRTAALRRCRARSAPRARARARREQRARSDRRRRPRGRPPRTPRRRRRVPVPTSSTRGCVSPSRQSETTRGDLQAARCDPRTGGARAPRGTGARGRAGLFISAIIPRRPPGARAFSLASCGHRRVRISGYVCSHHRDLRTDRVLHRVPHGFRAGAPRPRRKPPPPRGRRPRPRRPTWPRRRPTRPRPHPGLYTKVVEPGTGTEHPGPADTVVVLYTGWTKEGRAFDSSALRNNRPSTFALNTVLPGWSEGVQMMVKGETRRLWVPENLAFNGRRRASPRACWCSTSSWWTSRPRPPRRRPTSRPRPRTRSAPGPACATRSCARAPATATRTGSAR